MGKCQAQEDISQGNVKVVFLLRLARKPQHIIINLAALSVAVQDSAQAAQAFL